MTADRARITAPPNPATARRGRVEQLRAKGRERLTPAEQAELIDLLLAEVTDLHARLDQRTGR